MAKKLMPIDQATRAKKLADLVAFLEENDYSYVSTADGFLVAVKELEIVEDHGIITPPKQELIK